MRNKRLDGKETHDTKTEVNGAESLLKEVDLLSDPHFIANAREESYRHRFRVAAITITYSARGEPIARLRLSINNFGEMSSVIN